MATGPSGSPASTATMFVGDQGGLPYGRCPLRCPGSQCDARALRTTYPAQCDARPRLVHARRGIERATRLPDPCGRGRREAPQEEAEKEEAKEAHLSANATFCANAVACQRSGERCVCGTTAEGRALCVS